MAASMPTDGAAPPAGSGADSDSLPAAAAQLPFFVYGTLLAGHGFKNHERVVRGRFTRIQRACIRGKVFHFDGFPGLFDTEAEAPAVGALAAAPMASAGATSGAGATASAAASDAAAPIHCGVVVGQLISGPACPVTYAELLRDLDALEEYWGPDAGDRNVYDRVVRRVRVFEEGDDDEDAEGTVVEAYVYLSKMDRGTGTPVHHGDWRAFMASHGLADKGDDWKDVLDRRGEEVLEAAAS